MDSGSDSGAIVFFWSLIVLGTFGGLVLAGMSFKMAAIGVAVGLGLTAAVFAALWLIMFVGAGSVLAVLTIKDRIAGRRQSGTVT